MLRTGAGQQMKNKRCLETEPLWAPRSGDRQSWLPEEVMLTVTSRRQEGASRVREGGEIAGGGAV